jgi:membrane complex biogenesis BtpA family protein
MQARPFLGLERPLLGVVHLLPLPGSPRYGGSLDALLDRALRDAEALLEGGMDGLLAENFGDLPFLEEAAGPEVPATMAVVLSELRRLTGNPLGVNVLRNDARAALAAAAAARAEFVRVNVHTHAALTDQGVVSGRAGGTLRYRAAIGADVRIVADVAVKHAVPLADVPLEQLARETVERGLADALVVTGPSTGEAPLPGDLRRAREAVAAPVLVGSGLTPANAGELLPLSDGAIVGSVLRNDGRAGEPVVAERVARLVDAARGAA